MSDAILGFIGGLFCGGLLGFVVAALVTMGARETEKELDDVLDELLETARKQGKPTCLTDDERRKELEERYRKE